jgi:hypothetical protein
VSSVKSSAEAFSASISTFTVRRTSVCWARRPATSSTIFVSSGMGRRGSPRVTSPWNRRTRLAGVSPGGGPAVPAWVLRLPAMDRAGPIRQRLAEVTGVSASRPATMPRYSTAASRAAAYANVSERQRRLEDPSRTPPDLDPAACYLSPISSSSWSKSGISEMTPCAASARARRCWSGAIGSGGSSFPFCLASHAW